MSIETSPDDSWNAGPLEIAPPQGMDDDEVSSDGHLSRDGGDRDQFLYVSSFSSSLNIRHLTNPTLRLLRTLQNPLLSSADDQEFLAAFPQSKIAPTTPNTDPTEEFDIEDFVKGFDFSPG